MGLGPQEEYYLTREADDYFNRNVSTEDVPPEYITKRIDQCVRLLDQNGIQPKRILEIGGAGGLFLEELSRRYGAECLGIEPSASAVVYANQNRSGITVTQGVASALPEGKTGYFDLVVLKGVFCWIGRHELLKSIAEVDRVLAEGGHLLIADYLPEYPRRNRNTHVQDTEIYCFKIDHAKIFLDTHLYTLIAAETYFDADETFKGRFDDTRNKTSLLRKSYSDYYISGGG